MTYRLIFLMFYLAAVALVQGEEGEQERERVAYVCEEAPTTEGGMGQVGIEVFQESGGFEVVCRSLAEGAAPQLPTVKLRTNWQMGIIDSESGRIDHVTFKTIFIPGVPMGKGRTFFPVRWQERSILLRATLLYTLYDAQGNKIRESELPLRLKATNQSASEQSASLRSEPIHSQATIHLPASAQPSDNSIYLQTGVKPAFRNCGVVASIHRSRTLADGKVCRALIEVRRGIDDQFQILVQDTSPADAQNRLRFHARARDKDGDSLFMYSDECSLFPLHKDACSGMGLYRVSAEEGSIFYYTITDTADKSIFSGAITLRQKSSEPMETGRPGCWGQSEFPTEPMQPITPLAAPRDADRVCYMLVDVPLPGEKFGKLGVHIYRQVGGLLFITEDVTPEGPAPFFISDISFGTGLLATGGYRFTIGPSYNGYFTPQQVTRRGIGRFFLSDQHIAKHHPNCIAVKFDFRVCDAEGRELTSFSTEVDMPPNALPGNAE